MLLAPPWPMSTSGRSPTEASGVQTRPGTSSSSHSTRNGRSSTPRSVEAPSCHLTPRPSRSSVSDAERRRGERQGCPGRDPADRGTSNRRGSRPSRRWAGDGRVLSERARYRGAYIPFARRRPQLESGSPCRPSRSDRVLEEGAADSAPDRAGLHEEEPQLSISVDGASQSVDANDLGPVLSDGHAL